MMESTQHIVDKVRKLYALADGNANVHEAIAAIAAAERLLEWNRIEYDGEVVACTDAEQVTEVTMPVVAGRRRLQAWQLRLLRILADHHACEVVEVIVPNAVTTYVKGSPDEVGLVQELYKRLVSQIWKVSTFVSRVHGASSGVSFRGGLIAAVAIRFSGKRLCLPASISDASESETQVREASVRAQSVKPRSKDQLVTSRLKETDDSAFNRGLRCGEELYMDPEEFLSRNNAKHRAAYRSGGNGQ